jgi:hypothetical protein
MLQSEDQQSRRGGDGVTVLRSTDAFAEADSAQVATRNFKTFRRRLSYCGLFVHVRSFGTGTATTALWVDQDLAQAGSDEIASGSPARRVERGAGGARNGDPTPWRKTWVSRPRRFQMEQIRLHGAAKATIRSPASRSIQPRSVVTATTNAVAVQALSIAAFVMPLICLLLRHRCDKRFFRRGRTANLFNSGSQVQSLLGDKASRTPPSVPPHRHSPWLLPGSFCALLPVSLLATQSCIIHHHLHSHTAKGPYHTHSHAQLPAALTSNSNVMFPIHATRCVCFHRHFSRS